jgi:hypothetical protein
MLYRIQIIAQKKGNLNSDHKFDARPTPYGSKTGKKNTMNVAIGEGAALSI